MSRKNRSKFIAFRLNNNQICKAAFVQYDESAARQISAHQPQPATTATAWTAQHLPPQGQHPAPAHSRPAPEDSRGTPAPRREGRGRQQHQSPETAPRRGRGRKTGRGQRPAPAPKEASTTATASRRTEGHPAAPADAIPQPARQQSQRRPGDGRERTERRERREREERPENDSIRAPPSLRPRYSQRPGAPAILPAIPAYTARGQPRRAPEDRGINSAFVEYAELPLTNAAHAIPGEARQGGRFTF